MHLLGDMQIGIVFGTKNSQVFPLCQSCELTLHSHHQCHSNFCQQWIGIPCDSHDGYCNLLETCEYWNISRFLHILKPQAKWYGSASRQLQRLEMVIPGRINSLYGEVVAGSIVIRAFGAQSLFLKGWCILRSHQASQLTRTRLTEMDKYAKYSICLSIYDSTVADL